MYIAILDDDTVITGNETPWHDLPLDIKIKKIQISLVKNFNDGFRAQVADDEFIGFDSFGFQMYDTVAQGGGEIVSQGLQVIGVIGDFFVIFDLNLSSGKRTSQWKPLAEMTYNKALLRNGIGRSI